MDHETRSDTSNGMRTGDTLAVAALVLATVASIAGIVATGLYRDTAESVRQARATDLVTLLVAVPALALGLWRARTGSIIGRAIAIGALGYLAYSYAIFAFSVVINPMTPAHIAIMGLAAWGLMFMVFGLGGVAVESRVQIRLPRRTTGGYLIVVAAMFGLLWLSQIAGAVSSGALPTSISDLGLPTSPVYALDLAFAVPLLMLAGRRLIRLDRLGPAAAVAALAFIVAMGASVLAIFAVDGAAGIAIEVPPVAIFGAVTVIAAVLLVMGVLTSHPSSAPRAQPVGT
jgi:hypothetical protein